jgi:hypothetical protein
MRRIFRSQLSEREIYDYVVSAKRKEIIAPNLPLSWRIYAVDGYDGGLLPLARYIHLQRLFLDEDDILVDGRLREGLERIPPSRLLSILGTRYVITDKVQDVWIDDVFYDLAFDAALGAGTVNDIATEDIPRFVATGAGLVSYLEGAQVIKDGTPVAEVRFVTEGGETYTFTLRAGQETAEGQYEAHVAHTQAKVGHTWREATGSDYVSRLNWVAPAQVSRVEVSALPFGGRIHIRGLTLVDGRDGSNVSLIVSTDGRFRQVHSGDVKIYEVLDALPRAYIVHRTRILDDEAAIAALADRWFSPAQEAILAQGQPLQENPLALSQAVVTEYEPERITIQASTEAPGYLILSDAWYPGWAATVDGQRVNVERANVHFRGVYLEPGTHTVRFVYRPVSYLVGLGISITTLVGIVIAAVRFGIRRSRVADV